MKYISTVFLILLSFAKAEETQQLGGDQAQKQDWTKYFNASDIDSNIKKYLDDYVKEMDVRSKIVTEIDKSMDELKKKNPNFTDFHKSYDKKEGGFPNQNQNVQSLASLNLPQRLNMIGDFFDDL